MGRASIFLVMGLGVVFAIIGLNMQGSTSYLVKAQMGYSKYTIARDLARLAVHTTLRAYDRNLSPIPTSGAFNGGTYSVTTKASGDTLWLTTVGTYADSSYTMNVKLLRTTKPFPKVNAALGIRATPVAFTLSGKAQIDGQNYDSTGTKLIGTGNVPGVATMTKTDSTTVKKAGGTNITGSVPVKVDTSTVDPLSFLNEYKNGADYTYDVGGTYTNVTWGSPSAPSIIYCNAGDDPAYSIKFTGNVVGYGILVIRGNVQFNANFTFTGLVIIDGFNAQVQLGQSGTPQVIGGVIVAGNAGASISLKGTGTTGKIMYSAAALKTASNVAKLRFYSIMEWFE
jgi:hypothetical protein